MENNTFFATVTENNILNIDGSAVSDSVKFIKIRFSFPATWDGFAKTVVFKNGDTKCSVILDEKSELCIDEDECYIPHEVIKTPMLSFAVFGIFEDSKATSSWAAIRIIKGCGENGDAPLDPTPTEYEQLLKISEETKKIAQSVRDDADNGAFKGEKGDTGAKGETGATGAKGAPGAKGDKGDKGDAFTYGDFTAEQLAELKGAKGDKGDKGDKGETGEVTEEQMNAAIAAEVSAEKNRANNAFANALKGAVSGSAVRMDDVSPVEHTFGVKVRNNNLFDVSSSVGFQSRYQGVTSTISGTTITATSTTNRSCSLLLGDLSAGTHTISFSNTDFSFLMLQYGEALGQLSRLDNIDFKSTKSHTFTLTQPAKLWLESTIGTNQTRTITDIQLEPGSTATPHTPFISDLTSVTVTEYGKNLFNKSASEKGWLDSNTGNIVNSTTSYTSGFIPIENSNTYFCTGSKLQNWACLYDENKNFLSPYLPGTGSTGSFSLTINNPKAKYMRLTIPDIPESDLGAVQIELGPTATTYEPFKPPTEYTPAADGIVSDVKSLYPTTTLITNTAGVIIEAEYNRDINKAFAELQQAILSMGGNV